jgi:hypothetical protein
MTNDEFPTPNSHQFWLKNMNPKGTKNHEKLGIFNHGTHGTSRKIWNRTLKLNLVNLGNMRPEGEILSNKDTRKIHT